MNLLKEMCAQLAANIEGLIEEFRLPLKKYGDLYLSNCFLHHGNNKSAFNFYPEGYSQPGYWVCHTRGCHEVFRSTAIGLVRGLLSVRENGWPYGQIYGWGKTLKWCEAFLKGRPVNIEQKKLYDVKQIKKSSGIPREEVRRRLIVPSPYFLKRGFSPAILDKFDVGDCYRQKAKMYKRAVVPVYSQGLMVGCTGRSIFEMCSRCENYHPEILPCSLIKKGVYCKWRNSGGNWIKNCLFNWENAKEVICRRNACILVEGAGDILKLEEAGINWGLGLFSNKLRAPQQILLESLSVKDVIVALDNDEAGNIGFEQIKKKLKKSHNVIKVELTEKDVGDMTIEEIRRIF